MGSNSPTKCQCWFGGTFGGVHPLSNPPKRCPHSRLQGFVWSKRRQEHWICANATPAAGLGNPNTPNPSQRPSSLPQRAPLDCCHRTRQRPLPDRADAMGTRTPREVPTGLTGTQEVTMEYAKRKYPERGARAGISTGVLKEVFPHKVLLPATNGWSVPSCLNQRSSD